MLDIVIDGQSYQLGSASGDGYNCLIDTLRQKLPGVICSVSGVRAALEERHRNLPTRIAPRAYLPLDIWADIVDLCGLTECKPSAQVGHIASGLCVSTSHGLVMARSFRVAAAQDLSAQL